MRNTPQSAPKELIIWILVADGKQAQIYTRQRKETRTPLPGNARHHHYNDVSQQTLVPVGPAIYAKPVTLYEKGNKRLGRVFESANSARHKISPHKDVGEEIREDLVKTIAEYLNTARAKQQFNRLVLVAPAKILGMLRKHLNKTVVMSVVAELTKNMTAYGDKQLSSHLEDIL